MLQDRPWLRKYSTGVPADVEVGERNVPSYVAEAAERWPRRVAVDFFGATTTFARLSSEVARAAEALRGIGVRAGDRVSLVMPNCTSHVVAFHAVLSIGAIAVEHNPTYSIQQLHDQFGLADCSVAIVWRNRVADAQSAAVGTGLRAVVSADVANDLPRTLRLALRLPVASAKAKRTALTGGPTSGALDWHQLRRAQRPRRLDCIAMPDDTALLLFTGGTTGEPKCAELTHRNLVANATQGAAWAQFRPGEETVYGMLPFFHAFGMMFCLVLPPTIGSTTVAFANFDPPTVIKAMKRRPASFVPGVAPMFPRLLDAADAEGIELSSIGLAFSGAMALDPQVTKRWEDATGGLLIEGYGMSESSPIVLGNPCSHQRRPGTLGIPFPNTDIRVVDGELLVKGPQVFRGYWRNPEATAAILHDGWLHTSDIVEVDDSGHVTLVDRVKEMINVNGFKVFPSQVEENLRLMPGVQDVAVVGVPGSGTGEEVAAVVVPSGTHQLTLAGVREFALEGLPHYAVPRHLHIVDALPVSMIGKVMRRLARDDVVNALKRAPHRPERP